MRLSREPDFVKFWLGQTISELGSLITRDGLPLAAILVLEATPAQMGLLSAVQSAPVLLTGLLAGVWVDRLRRRPILIASDLARALLVATIPLAAWLGILTLPQLVVITALTSILAILFQVARESFVPTLVGLDHIVEANSKLTAGSSLAEIGGAALTGFLVQAITAPIAILFDAISYLFSALSVALIRTPERDPEPRTAGRSVLRDVASGVQLVACDPVLRALAGYAATNWFFGGFIGALYGLYAIRELGMQPLLLELLIASGGLGSLVAGLMGERAVRRFGLGHVIVVTATLGALVVLLIPLARGPLPLAAALLLLGQVVGDWLGSVFDIAELSLRQALVPDQLLGRANATINVLAAGSAPLGALVGGVLAQEVGTR